MSNASLPLANCELDCPVAIQDNKEVNFSDLLDSSYRLAQNLPDTSYTVSLCKDRIAFTIAFCATLIKKATNLLPANKKASAINEIAADHPGCICLYDDDMELPSIPCFKISKFISGKSNLHSQDIPQIDKMHTAAIAFTSGSTGKPTAHKKYWQTLVGTTHKLAKRFLSDLDNKPTIVATVPSQHMYGLEMTVLMLLHGHCIMDSSHPFYAQEIVERLSAIQHPRMLVTTPIHLRTLLGSGLHTPTIKRTISATAPLPENLAEEAEDRFGGTVEEIYGCTEAGSSATRHTISTSHWDLLDNMSLSKQDDIVFITGDHLEEKVPLQDKLNVISDTKFEFLGRSEDLLNVGGKRASLADLSIKILEISGVDDAIVFLPESDDNISEQRPAALVVTDLNRNDLSRAISNRIDSVFIPRPIKIISNLPRSENGKIQRSKLLQLLSSDD